MLQFVPQDSVSQAMHPSRGLVWLYLHKHSLQKLKRIFHGIWIFQIDTVNDTHKHSKAVCNILDIMKHNGLLNHNRYIQDLVWNGTTFTFTTYKEEAASPSWLYQASQHEPWKEEIIMYDHFCLQPQDAITPRYLYISSCLILLWDLKSCMSWHPKGIVQCSTVGGSYDVLLFSQLTWHRERTAHFHFVEA